MRYREHPLDFAFELLDRWRQCDSPALQLPTHFQNRHPHLLHCSILRLPKAATISALSDNPGFSGMFITYLLSGNLKVEEDLVDQLFNSSEKRLARLLLLLANFGKDGKHELVIPRMSQETLAEMIGTTRSRVSFFLNKFPTSASLIATTGSRSTVLF